MKTLQQQFNEITKIKIFEIEVINTLTNESDYLIFDISINGNNLIAQHEPTTQVEKDSDKISFVLIEIDEYFSIDENLAYLLDECTNKITKSEFFTIVN